MPDEPLVSFGLAGALVAGLAVGTLVTARQIVDEEGSILWEGEPLAVRGAEPVVLCAAHRVIDDPAERARLAAQTAAAAVDMESGVLAATGRLVGALRAISDGPKHPVGRLAAAAHSDGSVAWAAVARAFLTEPITAARAAAASRKALTSLEQAAGSLARAGS
jgi:nucleoside phosphorylase